MNTISLCLLAAWLALGAGAEDVRFPGQTLDFEGAPWRYYEAGPAGDEDRPLVVLLHGAGGSGGSYLANTGFGELARREGFWVVAPNAPPRDPSAEADFQANPRLWRFEQTPFLAALVREMQRRHGIDPARVYAVGHSNGAMMAFHAVQQPGQPFAAVAGVGAPPVLEGGHAPRALVVLCAEDSVVPVGGGDSRTPWGSLHTRPMLELTGDWAASAGYARERAWQPLSDDCQGIVYGPLLQVLLVGHQGHLWPGWSSARFPTMFGPNRAGFPLARRIWDFFQGRSLSLRLRMARLCA